MKLTTNKLFYGILLFGLTTSLLVIFNINYLYLKAIFSFVFLATIPGLLIMLMMKIRKIWFWEYLVYVIGSSIAFLMFAGLAMNWSLPWLNITSRPLSLMPLSISFVIILTVLGIIAYKQNKRILLKINVPKPNLLNLLFFIVPIIFPILSILGSTTLNNGGSNYLTMTMLGLIIIYVFLVVILREKLNEHIFPWSILAISISLLLTGWLRSWSVSGADINLEYHIFQLVKSNQQWSMSLLNNAYTACLSITLLPTILSIFMKINDQYIFKLFMPLIFSITPVCVYLFLRKYSQPVFAFISIIFFMSQSTFISWWWIPVRQEVALLFFTMVLMILFNKTIGLISKNLLLIIFLFSMIVSHYSTTYIALGLFIFTYLICLIFRKTVNINSLCKLYEKVNLKIKGKFEKRRYFLNKIIIISFVLFSFFWYAQVTGVSNNFVGFAREVTQNIGRVLSDDVRTGDASFGLQWKIFYKQKDETISLQKYTDGLTAKYKNLSYINTYDQEQYKNYKSEIIYPDLLPLRIGSNITSKIYLSIEVLTKLIKVFIIINVFYLIFIQIKKGWIDIEYIIMVIVSLLGMAAILVLPFASIGYDPLRQYQQLLAILSLPAVLGALTIFKLIKNKNYQVIAVSLIFLLNFMSLSGFIPQILGGSYSSMQLNNSGSDYDEFYVNESEIKSSAWLFENRSSNGIIYADERASYKLLFSKNANPDNIIKTVFPSVIDTKAYVYSSDTNTLKKIAFVDINGELIDYNFPTEFLRQNKNLIYSNGYSNIYK